MWRCFRLVVVVAVVVVVWGRNSQSASTVRGNSGSKRFFWQLHLWQFYSMVALHVLQMQRCETKTAVAGGIHKPNEGGLGLEGA